MKSSNTKPIAAVVVTYNRKELLMKNIGCLMRQTFGQYLDIIIIDNASTDGTAEALKKYAENGSIIYINTGANLGGAGGFQFGIRYAVENGYDLIWIMDDDSMPRPNALEELVGWHIKLKGRYGFLSSKVLWKDGSICKMNQQKINLYKKAEDFDAPVTKISSATFVSIFFGSKIVRRVGLPIKEFFIWCDDLEYTRRISKKYPCYLITSSVVEHHCATNIGSDIAFDTADRLDRYSYAYRNEVYYFKREGLLGMGYFIVRLMYHIFRILVYSKDAKAKRLSIIISSTLRGLRFDPKIQYPETNEK